MEPRHSESAWATQRNPSCKKVKSRLSPGPSIPPFPGFLPRSTCRRETLLPSKLQGRCGQPAGAEQASAGWAASLAQSVKGATFGAPRA